MYSMKIIRYSKRQEKITVWREKNKHHNQIHIGYIYVWIREFEMTVSHVKWSNRPNRQHEYKQSDGNSKTELKGNTRNQKH